MHVRKCDVLAMPALNQSASGKTAA
jgi:hypothetical protein